MNTEIIGILSMFLATVLLAIPLGKYIAKIYAGDKTFLDPVLGPLEKIFFKISDIDPHDEMNWKEHLYALLTINLIWFFFCLGIILF